MVEFYCQHRLHESNWSYDDIQRSEPDRAALLSAAGSPTALTEAIRDALDQTLTRGDVRLGREHAGDARGGYRAVVQFSVNASLFDWFFNGRTGYRAHFRAHYACGLGFNNQIVEVVWRGLDAKLPDVVSGRELNSAFEDCGDAQIPKKFLKDSLVPNLSKVWFCAKRIGRRGGIEPLPSGVGGPRIVLDDDISWAAPYRNDGDTWLDVKGAFLGRDGPYQSKDPICRAKILHTSGEA